VISHGIQASHSRALQQFRRSFHERRDLQPGYILGNDHDIADTFPSMVYSGFENQPFTS
jgi:hypothetical protein